MAIQIAYVDTSVIADWIFIESLTKKQRNKIALIAKNVFVSWKLINNLLTTKNKFNISISEWSICEAVSTVKMSVISQKLAFDNVSLRYLRDLKDKEPYKLSIGDSKEISKNILDFKRKSKNRINILKVGVDQELVNKLITRYCFDTSDALHLALAILNKCDTLITRDKDFLDRKKELKKLNIQVKHPKELLHEFSFNPKDDN